MQYKVVGQTGLFTQSCCDMLVPWAHTGSVGSYSLREVSRDRVYAAKHDLRCI